jgi:hypothetical protein
MKQSKTTDKWTEYGRHLKKELAVLKHKPFVKVGILEKDYPEEKKVSADDKQSGGSWPKTLGAVATYNEFGAPNAGIPERSFIRWTHDEKRDKWSEETARLKKLVVSGKMGVGKALGVIGLMIQADIQLRIASNVPPPNKPETLARKESSVTLINTSQLRTSIHYAVFNAGEVGNAD